jgi:long-chain fatty acid transport protein
VKKKVLTLLIACVLLSNNMYPSGFQINENGARAMAMAGAFTGLANDPSAIYFNPAGITQLDGTQIYAGATMIIPIQSFTGPSPSTTKTDMISQTFFPINFYATHKFTDQLSVGLGVNNQFGLGTKWDANWVGSQLAVETSVKTFFFTPVVAYKVLDNLSLSVGANIATGSVIISNKISSAVPTMQSLYPNPLVTLTSNTATAVGYTAGVLYKPFSQLQIGACYRSKTKFDFTGSSTSNPASFVHPVYKISINYPYGDITSSLTTPPDFSVGVAYFPCDKWTITADYQWVGWTSYDSLKVAFTTYKSPSTGKLLSESIPRLYQDSYFLRLGTEYKPNDILSLRAGVYYDHNPIQDAYVDPTLPDNDRIGLNIGAGYNFTNKLRVDVSYLLLLFADRTVTNSAFGFNGTYSNIAHLIGLDLSYNF